MDPRQYLEAAADWQPVRSARETVSPWLWIVPLVTLTLAVLNRRDLRRVLRRLRMPENL